MRRVSFEFFTERLQRVWQARSAASLYTPAAIDGRPHRDDLLSLALHALETHGPTCGPLEIADEWLGHLACHWHEYGVALENLKLGINPPTSGTFNNDYYGECTGGASRAEVWGMLQPADPVAAAQRAAEDARIDHSEAAVDVAKFVAAAAAEAFSTVDLRACIRVGLRVVPTSSKVFVAAESVLTQAAAQRDWSAAWSTVVADWGHPEPTNALYNFAGLLLALVGGELSWHKTLEISTGTGGDAHWKSTLAGTFLALMGVQIEPPSRSGRNTVQLAPSALGDIDVVASSTEFTDKMCRLAVACARPGEVELTGAPYLPAPGPHVAPPVRLFARYEGEPVLSPRRQTAVFLERANDTQDIPGTVEIRAPAELKVEALGGVIVPGKIAARAVNVALLSAEGRPGLVHAEIRRTGRAVAEATFGFRLSSRYVALGPFDNCDGTCLEKAYLPEANLDEQDARARPGFHKKEVLTSGDTVNVDGVFGAVGPRIIYLLRTVNAPSARAAALHVGCSDGIKLWLNGKRLLSDHNHRYATPRDYILPCSLKKGANRITVKLARCGRTTTFRLRITERDTEQAMTDLWDQL